MKKDFLSVADCTPGEFKKLLDYAVLLKQQDSWYEQKPLSGRTIVTLYEKPSLRTRLSFQVAMAQLGGTAIELKPEEIGMNTRESMSDVAGIISHMGNALIARTFLHSTLEKLASFASVPVVNALSDREHPCQALADFLTMMELKGLPTDLKVAYVGDAGNNVTHSLALAAALSGIRFSVGSPPIYSMDPEISLKAQKIASNTGAYITEVTNPFEAVKQADVVITDTWVSMGDEVDRKKRIALLQPYQINATLMKLAKPDAIFLHCMPVYRGFEVTQDVVDGAQSYIFSEAENRLHVQKALLMFLLGGI